MISRQPHPSATRFVLASLAVSFAAGSATAQGNSAFFLPGNLVVSRSVFSQNPALPAYPFVFNADLVDASFGITSRILLDQLTPTGPSSTRSKCRTARRTACRPRRIRWSRASRRSLSSR